MQQQNTIGDMYSILGNAMRLPTKMFELKSLYVDGHKYVVGDKLYVDSSLNFTPHTCSFTHVITKLSGTLNDARHEIECEDLKTQEHIIINI